MVTYKSLDIPPAQLTIIVPDTVLLHVLYAWNTIPISYCIIVIVSYIVVLILNNQSIIDVIKKLLQISCVI